MVWVSLCRVYLAVSLALNDRSPTGRFAFVSSFLDHRHLVTGVTSCIDYEDDTSLSLSLSLLRAKWKGKEEFEDGCYFNERDPRVERRIVSLRIESFGREKFVIGLWVLKKISIHLGFWMNFYSIERRSILCGEIYNSRRDKNSVDDKEESEESREDFNTNKNIYPYNVPRYPCNGIEN